MRKYVEKGKSVRKRVEVGEPRMEAAGRAAKCAAIGQNAEVNCELRAAAAS